jgi:hypothetical protein
MKLLRMTILLVSLGAAEEPEYEDDNGSEMSDDDD